MLVPNPLPVVRVWGATSSPPPACLWRAPAAMASAQDAAEVTSSCCVDPSEQIHPSMPPTLMPNPPAVRVWGTASSPAPVVFYVA
ncbi:uncharacterized protein LOC123402978 [Hordeum vulgare subsp. vulgare]|uniref:uncharacterized protein LOC123402978 n=1 Tax=Hordeum vulgare subsp. vulgare TaxID=112509 RepID=UPI001D1A44E4|nr:uncharacterized protein LOC123402978 [Hordeum vulgare subsp. vulgare]